MIVNDSRSESYDLYMKPVNKKLNSLTGAFLYCPLLYLSMVSSHFDLTSKLKVSRPISLSCSRRHISKLHMDVTSTQVFLNSVNCFLATFTSISTSHLLYS